MKYTIQLLFNQVKKSQKNVRGTVTKERTTQFFRLHVNVTIIKEMNYAFGNIWKHSFVLFVVLDVKSSKYVFSRVKISRLVLLESQISVTFFI